MTFRYFFPTLGTLKILFFCYDQQLNRVMKRKRLTLKCAWMSYDNMKVFLSILFSMFCFESIANWIFRNTCRLSAIFGQLMRFFIFLKIAKKLIIYEQVLVLFLHFWLCGTVELLFRLYSMRNV